MKKRKLLTLTLALALLVTTVFTGCGGSAQDGAAKTDLQVAFATRYETPVTTWDPSIVYDTGNQVMHNFYEMLLKYDANSDTFIPVLATEYSKSDDGLVWTFKLRQGVKFHDGTDFNAEAVKFSIDRTIAGQMGSAYIWGPVKEIKVVDDYTVPILSQHSGRPLISSYRQRTPHSSCLRPRLRRPAILLNPRVNGSHRESNAERGRICCRARFPATKLLQPNSKIIGAAGTEITLTRSCFKLIPEGRLQKTDAGKRRGRTW